MTRLLPLVSVLAILGAQAIAQTVNVVVIDGNISETRAAQTANPGQIRVTRTGSTAAALTVWVKVQGTAVRGVDYSFGTAVGESVTIPVGSAQLNISITALDDFLTEGTETLRFELDDETSSGTPLPYLIGANDRVDLNLLDNEDPLLPPRAIVGVASLDNVGTENSSGTDPASFRVSRTNNLNVAIAVLYTLSGTATAGSDYTIPPATINIPAGVAFVDVIIAPINDDLVENPEGITFTLQPHSDADAEPPPPEAYVLDAAVTASVEIRSDDLAPPPTVAITAPANGSSQTSYAANPISVSITFTASDVNGHIVSYRIFDGTRVVTSGLTNYPTPPVPGTLYDGSFTMLNAYGGTHQLRVQVTDNSGVVSTSALVAVTVTYIYPIMTVAAVDAEAAEVASPGVPNPTRFAITVDTPMPIDQYVFYRLTSPGPGLDFELPLNYSLTHWPINIFTGPTDYGYAVFPAGTTRVEIAVTPVDDLHLEGPEVLTMTLSYPFVITEQTFEGIVQFTEGGFYLDPNALPVRNFQYDIGTVRTATATIQDNDTVPAPFSVVNIAVTDADAQETAPSISANAGVFTITRNGPASLPLTVNYTLTTPPRPTVITPQVALARNGVDYTALTGTATIPAGATSVDIVVAPIYDLLAEPSELVQITLLPSPVPLPDPSSYMLGAVALASLSIRDVSLAEGTPIVRIAVSDSQAYESNVTTRTAAFVVQRTGSLTEAIEVRYTISGSATNGVDYETLPGAVTLAAGSASAAIIVNPIADGVTEPDESVALTLQPPPLDVEPPPYVLGVSNTMQLSAGVSIRDVYTPPLTRLQRAWLWRHRHLVVQRPVAAPTSVVATAVATSAPAAWAVEASADLTHWEEIGTVESSEATDEFVDVNAGDFTARFYRFRPIPGPAQ